MSDTLADKEIEITNIRKGLNSWISKVKDLNLKLKSRESENILLKSQLKSLERELDKLRIENRKSVSQKNIDSKKY